MGLKDRILTFIEHKGVSVQKFEQRVGLSNASVSKMGDNTRRSTIDRISNFYPDLNINWLITGEGEMLNINHENETPQVIENEQELKEAIDKGIKLLPEVNFKFSAGQMELVADIESIKRYWYLPDCKDCEAVAQISGNSMSPAYPSGCWVALKKYGFSIEDSTQIPFGNVFGIVIEDKYTGEYHGHVKILRRYRDHSLSRKYWIAHSVNESEFDDFDIEIAQVRKLWIVKQHIVSDVLL